jgi:hypothetical protein
MVVVCGLLRCLGGEAPFRATSTTIFETTPKCGAVQRVWKSPRTRERRVEWRVGSPRTREWLRTRFSSLCRDVGTVQQHCGVVSLLAVFLRCGGVCL